MTRKHTSLRAKRGNLVPAKAPAGAAASCRNALALLPRQANGTLDAGAFRG